MAIDKKGTKQIADNRKARHDYFVLEQIECGIELVGTEVKSIRNGGVNLKDRLVFYRGRRDVGQGYAHIPL